MKQLIPIAFLLLLCSNLHAQNFIPLSLDSSWYWSKSIDIKGQTTISELASGYSYDANDSLVQIRTPFIRTNYAYGPNQRYITSENLSPNNEWAPTSRATVTYNNGQVVSRLTENYTNNQWINAVLQTYLYNASPQNTLQLTQFWANGAWDDFYKKVLTYDANGDNTEVAEYYSNGNGVLEYNRGTLSEYDNHHHKVQEIYINSSINGPYYTSRTNWVYGNDDLPDIISRCNFDYPNTGVCTNISRSTYHYGGQDTVEEKYYNWLDNNWNYYGKQLTFNGPGIYSDRPDSLVVYQYITPSMEEKPTLRRYMHYEDPGNDTVYFEEYRYAILTGMTGMELTGISEEWYHLKPAVNTDDLTHIASNILVSPNPCKKGALLTVQYASPNNAAFDILVFDITGRLVMQQNSGQTTALRAPGQSGVYTVVIKDHGQLMVQQIVVK